MRARKALAAMTLVSVTAIPVAIAHGKKPAQHLDCNGAVSVVLKGTLASDPAAGATSLALGVDGSNAHGAPLRGMGVAITLDETTVVDRRGVRTVEALAMNDRVVVSMRRCKADLPLSAATANDVAASRITANGALRPTAAKAPPPGKGKPAPAGPGCKPSVSVILAGKLTSDPEFAGAGTFTMSTIGANKAGKPFAGGADETITVGAGTKIRRQNAPKLVASLESGDRAVVHLRACKGDLPLDAAELTALTALRVNAKAPAAP